MADTSEFRAREIGNQILDYIRQARLQAGDQLPAEVEMAGQLGISRATIREVYVRLMAQGIIVRRHGLGTFVGQMPIQDDQTYQTGFAASIRAAGFTPTVDLVSVDRVPLGAELASELGCAEGTEASRLLRVFRANGDPVVLIEDHLAPGIDAAAIDLDAYAIDLIAGLATQTNMEGTRIDTWTTATDLSDERAELLELPTGHPALHIYSVIHSEAAGTVCVAWAWLNPRLMELKSSRRVNLSSPPIITLADEVTPVAERTQRKIKPTQGKKESTK